MSWGVDLTDVSFGWPKRPIAENVKLTIDFTQIGGRLPVIGPSGIGKSTLLYVMSGLMNPTSGIVTWTFPGGEQVAWSTSEGKVEDAGRNRATLRHREFAFSFQDDTLLPYFTIYENLLYPLEILAARTQQDIANLKERVEAALASVLTKGDGELQDIAGRYPEELSGGQRRRVALAQAMITDPIVLFADEPGGGLDPATRTEVMRVVQNWVAGSPNRAFVWVTHHRDTDEFQDCARLINVTPRRDTRIVHIATEETGAIIGGTHP